jgi:hypothetical protein
MSDPLQLIEEWHRLRRVVQADPHHHLIVDRRLGQRIQQVMGELAGYAEVTGLDSSPYIDLIANLLWAEPEQWIAAWRLTRRLQAKLEVEAVAVKKAVDEASIVKDDKTGEQTTTGKKRSRKDRPRNNRKEPDLLADMIVRKRNDPTATKDEIAAKIGIDSSRLSKEPFASAWEKLEQIQQSMNLAVAKGWHDKPRKTVEAIDPDSRAYFANVDKRLDEME